MVPGFDNCILTFRKEKEVQVYSQNHSGSVGGSHKAQNLNFKLLSEQKPQFSQSLNFLIFKMRANNDPKFISGNVLKILS